MGKDSPAPPDYRAAAEATGQSNIDAIRAQTIANRPDIYTPWGSQTWDRVGHQEFNAGRYLAANPDLTPETLAANQMSPYEHWLRHGQNEGRQGGEVEGDWVSRVNLTPEAQAALSAQQRIQAGRSQAAETLLGQANSALQTPMNWGALPARAGAVTGATFTDPLPQVTGIRNTVNSRNLQTAVGGMPLDTTLDDAGNIQRSLTNTAGDWRERAQEATWDAMTPLLDRSRNRTENQLANQGITRGSEAWRDAQMDLGDAEARARLASIAAGRDEANMLFNQDVTSGRFANEAQAQEFGQNLQEFGAENAALSQQFGQNLQQAQFGNAAQGQQFSQDLQSAQFGNSAQGQQFAQLMARAQQGDQRAMQQVQSAIAAGTFNNLNRNQAMTEEQTRRTQVLNELNALLSGQQVQNPNIPAFAQAGAGRGTDYTGAATSQYGAALDAANASNAQTGQTVGALASLAAMFAFSDARLKTDIRCLGVTKGGIKIYSYRFKDTDQRRIGVIAQQVQKVNRRIVRRDAASGMLMVNYAEIQ